MRKFATLVVLFGLTAFVTGCEQSAADKKADAAKKEMQAETDAKKAVVEGEAEKSDIDDKTAKKVGNAADKQGEAMKDAADADDDTVPARTK
jgi:hypothetical protein